MFRTLTKEEQEAHLRETQDFCKENQALMYNYMNVIRVERQLVIDDYKKKVKEVMMKHLNADNLGEHGFIDRYKERVLKELEI